MRYKTIIAATLLCTATYAGAAVGIYIGEPRVSIGINFPVYPEFVRVPNYPVYYAPAVDTNVFFYDGLYWVFDGERWYASSWYNGPWGEVAPEAVPLYVLRVPVRYYRHPPAYFRAWAYDAAPRWDVFWGPTWSSHRIGWDRWNRSYVPAAAPLPLYQRAYSGSRYPTSVQQQQVLQGRQYRYQPRDTVVRQYYRQNIATAPATTRAQQSTVTQPAVTMRTQQTRVQQQNERTQSAQAFAPGQVRSEQGAQSAREFAPGQVKRQQGAQSAREFAPGQVRKNQVAQAPQSVAPPQVVEQRAPAAANAHPNRGRGNRDAVEGEGEGNGHGQGHGRGHGKD